MRPSTWSITKKGAPSARLSGSNQRTAGTGTSLRAATWLITSNWVARSYRGKTGTAVPSGAIRATYAPCRLVPPLTQLASNSTDVLDSPPLLDIRAPLTASSVAASARPPAAACPPSSRRAASQRCSLTARVPILRSLTVILICSSGDRPSADAVTAASSLHIRSSRTVVCPWHTPAAGRRPQAVN
jgi:hypothetical protein